MGFFDKLFGSNIRCPGCGSHNARDTFAGIQCDTPGCRHHAGAPAPSASAPAARAATPAADFSRPLLVEYRNFRGERKTFTADRNSLRVKKAHFSMRVAPSGRRIALHPDRIVNRGEVEREMPAVGEKPAGVPSAHEAYVMRFHARRGSHSTLYQVLRQKYPSYR